MLGKVTESLAKKKVGAQAFHAAYKKAPGQTMGTWTKQHRWGVGFGVATMIPIHTGTRRSTHAGIDQK